MFHEISISLSCNIRFLGSNPQSYASKFSPKILIEFQSKIYLYLPMCYPILFQQTVNKTQRNDIIPCKSYRSMALAYSRKRRKGRLKSKGGISPLGRIYIQYHLTERNRIKKSISGLSFFTLVGNYAGFRQKYYKY